MPTSPKNTVSQLKVALVHDYLREYGGAERVLEALHEIWPDAPLYTAFVDQEVLGINWARFADWEIHQSWMTKIPGYKKLFSPLRLIAHLFFEAFDFSEYDVVISSSNMYFAKAVITKSWVPHICYCHTPPRSLYGYSTMTDWKKNPLVRVVGSWINRQILPKDQLAAQRVDVFVANSQEVKDRIKRLYNRDAVVIYPPVEVGEKLQDSQHQTLSQKSNAFKKSHQPTTLHPAAREAGQQPYFLSVNRLAFSKHPELAVRVCSELNLPLKVVGTGSLLDSLKQMAGPSVEFLGFVPDDRLHAVYAGAQALLYPVEDEDFGMVPVEAMGHGVPVIAHRSGGPKETIIEGVTGVFFDELTTIGLQVAVEKFQKQTWNAEKIHTHALQFSKAVFQERMKQLVAQQVEEFSRVE